MESLFDVPAHPLFVHAPVVLMPLLTLLTLVALHPRWRGYLRWPLAGGSVVVFVTVYLATQSGAALKKLIDSGGEINKHVDLAETTRLIAFALAIVCLAHGASARWMDRPERPRWIGTAMAGLTAVLAIIGTIWMIRTGHEGSRVHWKGTIKN
jgi:hypothetical protein